MEDKNVSLSAKDLQALVTAAVSAAVAEAKKPAPPTEEQIREMESKQEDRKANAQLQLKMLEDKKLLQKTCTHLRRDGSSRGVYVTNGNFILCQRCQAVIRPETDADLFNRLFQMTNDSGIFA